MSTTATSPSKPLATRSPNTSSPTKSTIASDEKPNLETTAAQSKNMSMDYHRQVLQNRLAADNADKTTYVSPSDTIMSPCTAKLSAYKGKKFAKAKPQSLFAKTTTPKTALPINAAAIENAGGEKETVEL